jgi:hypothetical protein
MFDLIDGFTAKVVGGFLAASIVVALVIRYQDSKTAGKPNSYTAADFSTTQELESPGGDPYTEAAYHQQPTPFAAATGDSENSGAGVPFIL